MTFCVHCGHGRVHRAMGVTLIELLVGFAVLSVLLTLAAPSFQATLQTWQRDRAVRTFTAHLSLARTEAIRTGRRAVVCISTDGQSCAPTDQKDWKHGWLVFIDNNRNGKRDQTEVVVATAPAQAGLVSMAERKSTRNFAFNPNGLMASGMGNVTVQPPDVPAYKITITRIGRVRIQQID